MQSVQKILDYLQGQTPIHTHRDQMLVVPPRGSSCRQQGTLTSLAETGSPEPEVSSHQPLPISVRRYSLFILIQNRLFNRQV